MLLCINHIYSFRDFLPYTELPHAYTHIEIHYKERFAISYLRSKKYTTQDLLGKHKTFYDLKVSAGMPCSL